MTDNNGRSHDTSGRRYHGLGSVLKAAVLPVVVAIAFTAVLVFALGSYGWVLFFALPFFIGMMAGVCACEGRESTAWHAVIVTATVVGVCCILLLMTGAEGLLCIAMALPLLLPLALLGGLVGYGLASTVRSPTGRSRTLRTIIILLMSAAAIEPALKPPATLFHVTTAVDVAVPPHGVWPHVVAFPQLPQPQEWLFRTGVAYPTDAEIIGTGRDAVRYCNFSTGRFVEPIDEWDEPHLLAFSVTEQAKPMREWSPYGDIEPPHMHGYFVSDKGQFRLVSTASGGTRLEGTTWYRHHMYPEFYWRLWSDWIIHTIHHRVLTHVKELAERGA